VYSLVFNEPKTAHEVICSKEGCRTVASPYDNMVYILGGRSTHAIKKLEVYDPLKNHFTIVSEECPIGVYNHTLVPYKNLLVFYGGQSTVPGTAHSFTMRDMHHYNIDTK
jgi:hypothetical protein